MTEKRKRPKAGFESWNYPWAITMGIGTPSGGSSPAPTPTTTVAESINDDFFGTRETADALRAHYEMHHPTLRPEHTEAINSYTKHSSILNKYLFRKKEAHQTGHGFEEEAPQEDRAKSISDAISSSKPYDKPFTVYSGMHSSIHPEIIKHNGEIFHMPKFMSASTDPDVAARFAGKVKNERHVVKFDIPAGYSHGMFVAHASHMPDEDEYLINKDRVVYIGNKIASHTNDRGVTTHVWQGKILDHSEAEPYAAKNSFARSELDSSIKKSKLAESVSDIQIPNMEENLGKTRKSMPQIKKQDFLKDIGPDSYSEERVPTATLKPTQKHFNLDKVRDMIGGKWNTPPVIVSNDNYIVDGHHTWIAAHNTSGEVPAHRVKMSIDDILSFLKGKPYVRSKSLNETVNTTSKFFEMIIGDKHV